MLCLTTKTQALSIALILLGFVCAGGYALDADVSRTTGDVSHEGLTADSPRFAFVLHEYAVGSNPADVAVGDFDGDGVADLAVADFGAGAVSVLYGRSQGGFGPKTDYPAGSFPRRLGAGDFNRDGRLDVLVTSTSDHFSVLYGTDAGLTQKADYPAPLGALPMAVADFNSDGILDLVVAPLNGSIVSVLYGQPTGGFAGKVDYAVGSYHHGVATGDFSADGRLDIAVSNLAGASISVLYGLAGGGFGGRTDYAVGNAPWGIATQDVNGDGRLDIVVANNNDNDVSVLYGQTSGGLGGRTDFAVGGSPTGVAVADFDLDGRMDMAVTNSSDGTVTILAGQSGGTFGSRMDIAGVGASAESMLAADVNSDGYPDLIVPDWATNTVKVLINGTGQILKITNTDMAAGRKDSPYEEALAATGGMAPYSWAVISGSLPPGLSLSPAGMISGTPSAIGGFSFTIRATDSSSPIQEAMKPLAIEVTAAELTITTETLPHGTVGTRYSTVLTATGGILPYGWSMGAGQLPPGLSMDPETGAISGTPTSYGTWAFKAAVWDSQTPPGGASRDFSLYIQPAAFRIATASLPKGEVGRPYAGAFSATGGERPYIWSIDKGHLPDGLALGADGAVGGVPTQAGRFDFEVAATDSSSPSRRRDWLGFSIVVLDPTVPPPVPTQLIFVNFDGVPYDTPPFSAADLGLDASETSTVIQDCIRMLEGYFYPYRISLVTERPSSDPFAYMTVNVGGVTPLPIWLLTGSPALAQVATPYIVDYGNSDHGDQAMVWTKSFPGFFGESDDRLRWTRILANTIAHEIGHNLGLWHAKSDTENLIMYPSPWSVGAFGTGRIVLRSEPLEFAPDPCLEEGDMYLRWALGTNDPVTEPMDLPAAPGYKHFFESYFSLQANVFWALRFRLLGCPVYGAQAVVFYPEQGLTLPAFVLGDFRAQSTVTVAIPALEGQRGVIMLSGSSTPKGPSNVFAIAPDQTYDPKSGSITALLLELPVATAGTPMSSGTLVKISATGAGETVGDYSAEVVAGRATVDELAISPSRSAGMEDLIWPDKNAPPTFSWTDNSGEAEGFYVDVSTSCTFPLKNGKQTIVLRVGKAGGTLYPLSRAQWKKARKLAAKRQGILYWRVRSRGAGGKKVFVSPVRRLTIDGGQWTMSGLDMASASPVVTWTHTGDGIIKYSPQFSVDPAFKATAKTTVTVPAASISGTSYALKPAMVKRLKVLAARNHTSVLYYRVRGEDADKAFVTYSDAGIVTVAGQ